MKRSFDRNANCDRVIASGSPKNNRPPGRETHRRPPLPSEGAYATAGAHARSFAAINPRFVVVSCVHAHARESPGDPPRAAGGEAATEGREPPRQWRGPRDRRDIAHIEAGDGESRTVIFNRRKVPGVGGLAIVSAAVELLDF